MKFWASAEVYQPVDAAVDRARRCVSPYLNAAFAASSLAHLEGQVRYVPIVMPEGMRAQYPARSKLVKKDKLYDCAPQLDYDIFVDGNFEAQIREYLRGIALSAPYLASLGATPQQVEEFNSIVSNAVERILVERPDQIRH